jgi:hypothetical protein
MTSPISSVRARAATAVVAIGAIAGTLALSGGCFSEAELGNGQIICPPIQDFRTVSQLLERRCGSADCHGVPGRPLRIYGQQGIRRPEPQGSPNVSDFDEYVSGGEVATTDAEVYDNYLAACALEPEKMALVVQGEEEVDSLTLIRKPRLEEKHKGGRVWDGATKGDLCLTSWIGGVVDKEACRLELERP